MNPDVHRGISVKLKPLDYAHVHDQSVPVEDRAHHLMDAVTLEGTQPVGQHWSTDLGVSEHFAKQYGSSHDDHTHVIFHATHPDDDEIENDEGWRAEHEVNDDEEEVPVRRGTDLEVKAVSWRKSHKPGEAEHPWNHHRFAEEQWHTASRRTAAGHQVWFHGTRPEAVPDIRERGLSAPPHKASPWYLQVTDNHEQAKVYAGPGGKVLEYHLPHEEVASRLGEIHPHNMFNQNAQAASIRTSLPSDYLVAEHDVPHRTASQEPVTIRYVRNPVSSQQHGDFGEQFAQHVEPHGRYLSERSGDFAPQGWETGEVTFHKPLRVPFGGTYQEPSNWKHQLSQRYDGKTGRDLSEALRADGHDGIITHDEYGTSEIVDLTGLHPREAARLLTCDTCGGSGTEHSPDKSRSWPCRVCDGDGQRLVADHWDPPSLHARHTDALDTDDYGSRSRKLLDLAKTPDEGTHVWRGEVRHKDDVHAPSSVGMHWSVNPNQVIFPPHIPRDHHRVVWQAVVDHPEKQVIPRSHPIWHGQTMSMDNEAEVRFKPGAQVRLNRAYVHHGETGGGMPAPRHSERTDMMWQAHDLDHHTTVEHKRPADGMMEYQKKFPDLFREPPHHTAKTVRKTERPQKCKYCKSPAIKSLLWAEGMAYVPVCGKHEANGRHRIEVANDDEVVGVHQIKATAVARWGEPVPEEGRFFHNTDHVFQPGDRISPASETGVPSRWSEYDSYSPQHVHMWHEDALTDGLNDEYQHFGRHTYEVRPQGHLEHDPEKEGRPRFAASTHAYRAPAAVVTRVWCGRTQGDAWPHKACDEPSHQEGHTAAMQSPGKGPLPIEPGKTWYRLHPKARPWSDATSAELAHGGGWKEWTRQPGFSAVGDPHELHHYLRTMGWYQNVYGKDSSQANRFSIVQFTGQHARHEDHPDKPRAIGGNGEYLIHPGPRADRIEIPLDEFRSRLRETPKRDEPGGWGHQLDTHYRALREHLQAEHPNVANHRSLNRDNAFSLHEMSHDHGNSAHTHDSMPTDHPFITDEDQHRTAAWTPHERIFGPTEGLDTRLFDGDHLKPDVRAWVLKTLSAFWTPRYGHSWTAWARVYFAGSEASEWTSPELVGNGDFDTLIGVDYDRCRATVPTFAHMSDDEITAALNADLRALDEQTSSVMIPVDGKPVGPFGATFYVNAHSWDIRDIKPYAAYDVTNDVWAVKPPHLPDWDISKFPEGPALLRECRAVAAYVRAVLALPEPERTQQGFALWQHLHSDRSRAFGPQGEGWWDSGNVIEKFLDQAGLWEKLVEIMVRAREHPETLNTPNTWSNDPRS